MKHFIRIALVTILLCVSAMLAAAQGSSSDYPDSTKTPGMVAAGVKKADTCVVGFTTKVRDVPVSLKKKVFESYGIPWEEHSGYEVDHFISLVLGGSNDQSNLWPQSYKGTWNARVKDRLEVKLHKMVCSGQISLKAAQEAIQTDWIAAFKKYVSPSPKPLKTKKGWGIL
jgi:hypothetical protein